MIKFALYPYIPQRYLKKASFEDIDRDRMILDFKELAKRNRKSLQNLIKKFLL